MPDQPYHAVLADLPKSSWLDGAITRTALTTDDAIIVFAWLRPGPKLSAHQASGGRHPDLHAFDQTNIVITGRVEITIGDDDRYEIGPGELLYIPGNVPHSGRVLGDEQAFVIEVFAPIREDYLHMAAHQPGAPTQPPAE